MLMAAVARVDHRDIGILCDRLNRPVPVMAYHQDVGIVRDHPGRVGNGFALGRRRGLHIRAADDRPSQALHRRFEAQARPRAGFVKQRRQDFPIEQFAAALAET